jgi:1-acyl-sn-glycerol-3-phosphate acyltransferase
MSDAREQTNKSQPLGEPYWPADIATIINSICGYSAFAFFCVTLPLFLPIALLLPGGRRRWIAIAMRYAMRTVFAVTPTVTWRFDGNLAALRTARVVVSNHEGMLDILAACGLPGWRTLLAKTWVFRAFPLGVAARAAGLCNSELLTPDAYQSEATMTLPDPRIGLFVFPEGRRSRSGIIDRFRPGAFVLAKHLPSTVVPVAVAGSRQGIRPGSMWIHPTYVHSRVLPEMSIMPDESYRQFAARVREAIVNGRREVMTMLLKSGKLDRHRKHRLCVLAGTERQLALAELRDSSWQIILALPVAAGPWILLGLGWSTVAQVIRLLYPNAPIFACEPDDARRAVAVRLWQRDGDMVVKNLDELPPAPPHATVVCSETGAALAGLNAWLNTTQAAVVAVRMTDCSSVGGDVIPLSTSGWGIRRSLQITP